MSEFKEPEVNTSRISARLTPQLVAKVTELLAPENTCLTPLEKEAIQADLESSATLRPESKMDEETVPVLHCDSLRLICRFSLFSLKDVLKDGRITSQPLSDTALSAAAQKPSEELRKRREYLRRRQEEKAYNLLVHDAEITPTQAAKQAQVRTCLSMRAS